MIFSEEQIEKLDMITEKFRKKYLKTGEEYYKNKYQYMIKILLEIERLNEDYE